MSQFVRLHGGRIAVRSALDAGMCFTVDLPQHLSAQGQLPVDDEEEEEGGSGLEARPGRGHRVLHEHGDRHRTHAAGHR